MSRDKRDQKGHKNFSYNKENEIVKEMTRRKRRHEGNEYADNYIPCAYCNDDGVACDMAGEVIADPCWCVANERNEPNPEKSTGGWLTW